MSADFEEVPGGIRVRDGKNTYHRVPAPDGFTEYMFRNTVAAFDSAYRLQGKLPSVSEVHKFWPGIPVKTISALFLTDEFKQALEHRGINWDPDSGLSLEQSMVLLAVTDFTDRRSLGVKLRDLKVPLARYQAWLKQPLFSESYRRRSEDNLKDAVPLALNRLVGNADAGDQRAIEKVLEITGRYNPAQMQLDDARTVVLSVIESVIRRVTDPEIRREIMNDVQAQVVAFDLTHQRQELEG